MKNDHYSLTEYTEAAALAQETATQMLARLDLVALQPQRILNLGDAAGFCSALLKTRYPHAEILSSSTGLKDHVDLITANLVIPWCADLFELFQEWRRLLRPEGLLMFTSLGPDTLKEFTLPILPRLIDMHDVGDELVHAGFADPVLDVEHFTLQYREWKRLLHELHVTTMINDADAIQPENAELVLTYEIVYGHAWGRTNQEFSENEDGIVNIPLEYLRGKLK